MGRAPPELVLLSLVVYVIGCNWALMGGRTRGGIGMASLTIAGGVYVLIRLEAPQLDNYSSVLRWAGDKPYLRVKAWHGNGVIASLNYCVAVGE